MEQKNVFKCLVFMGFVSASSIYAQSVTVNAGTTYQTISGFGAASALNAYQVYNNLSTIQNVLWADDSSQPPASQVNGDVGLSILRIAIDDSTTTGNWDVGKEVSVAVGALKVNPNLRIFASEWSPPAAWKNNNNKNGNNTGNDNFNPGSNTNQINHANWSAYATYQTNFVKACKATYGFTPYAISVQNEPDYDTSYDSCLWAASDFDTYIKTYLGPDLNAAGFNPIIMMPESFADNLNGSNTTMTDSAAATFVKAIGMHLYGGGPNTVPTSYSTTAGHTVESWETEISDFAANDSSMTSGLKYANQIHNCIVDHNFNAYNYWWILNINSDNEGLYGASNSTTPTKRLFCEGNFSKFIRPGFVRIACTESPSGGVSVSAYYSSSTNKVVVVAINNNGSVFNLPVTFSGLTVSTVYPWITDSGRNLVQQASVAVSGGGFTYSLPSQSVVSFVASTSSGGSTSTPTRTFTATATATPTKTSTATPSNTPSRTASATPTNTVANTPTGTATKTATSTASSTSTGTFTPTATKTSTPSPTATPTNTATSTATATASRTPTASPTPTGTPSNTASRTATPTASNTATTTATTTPSLTPTNTLVNSATPTSTATHTLTATPSSTASRTSTATASHTATVTASSTPSATPTNTLVNSATPSNTPTASPSPTVTFTPANTLTASATASRTPTASPTPTGTPSSTASRTASATPSATATDTLVHSATPTGTGTKTATSTTTSTPTRSFTPTPTNTLANTLTSTETPSATPSATPSMTPTGTPTAVTVPVSQGSNPPGNSSQLPGASNIAVQQAVLTNPSALAVNLTSLTLSVLGTGNPADITGLTLWENGVALTTTTVTGTAATYHFSASLPASTSVTFTVTGSFGSNANGTYGFSLTAAAGTNGQAAQFSGLPVLGATVTVSQPTATPSSTATNTATATLTFTTTPSSTPTSTPTAVFTHTPTSTPNPPTSTPTPTPGAALVVFPNPVTGSSVNVLPPAYGGSSDVRVEILTLSFRKVVDEVFPNIPSGTAVTVQLVDRWGHSLANGIYYVLVTADGKHSTAKLLILR